MGLRAKSMYRLTLYMAVILLLGTIPSCQMARTEISAASPPPLADSLMSVFGELHQAVLQDDLDRFLTILDPVEAANLKSLTRQRGFGSLAAYLRTQFSNWPELDTLQFESLVEERGYARLALIGPGSRLGFKTERTRYTFLLFKSRDQDWKLSAMTTIEKDRYDLYGHEITYHETDLPPRLRFPRRF